MSGPEVRIDQLTGLRTILAPVRADRPDAFEVPPVTTKPQDQCPFCEGNEDRTPPEVAATRPGGGEANGPGWVTRVVPNLYPALEPGAGPEASAPPPAESGITASADPLRASARVREPDLFSSRPAVGGHEVIVHAPDHHTGLGELSPEQLEAAMAAWRERMLAHGDASYVQLIVNEGPEAGASLEHTHAQLYALSFVPAAVARERERLSSYAERTAGGALLSDVLAEEVRRRDRLVAIDEDAALLCPWASRSPYELRIVPRRESARFEEEEAGAAMLGTAMRALEASFGTRPQLNLWIRTAPRGTARFHWHIDIAPRLAIRAGFELSTGVDINIYPPERAASDLRAALGE